jgi:hypothetical protein
MKVADLLGLVDADADVVALLFTAPPGVGLGVIGGEVSVADLISALETALDQVRREAPAFIARASIANAPES